MCGYVYGYGVCGVAGHADGYAYGYMYVYMHGEVYVEVYGIWSLSCVWLWLWLHV